MSDIADFHDRFEGIPLWLLAPSAPRAAVLLHHGLHSHKEAMAKEAWSLARAGYLVVAIDAVAHGERQAPRDWNNFEIRFASLRETALESARLVEHLRERFPSLERVGGLGVSLGAFTLFSAIAEFPGLFDAASLLLGSPLWPQICSRSELWQHSPHHWPERFFPTALLVQNAGRDEYVASADAREFVAELANRYEAAPTRLRYREYPLSGHFMRGEDWDEAWRETLVWFSETLSASRASGLSATAPPGDLLR